MVVEGGHVSLLKLPWSVGDGFAPKGKEDEGVGREVCKTVNCKSSGISVLEGV